MITPRLVNIGQFPHDRGRGFIDPCAIGHEARLDLRESRDPLFRLCLTQSEQRRDEVVRHPLRNELTPEERIPIFFCFAQEYRGVLARHEDQWIRKRGQEPAAPRTGRRCGARLRWVDGLRVDRRHGGGA